jgi:hypothetical protein
MRSRVRNYAADLRRATFVFAALTAALLMATPALAHVGSPDVFYEGDAGPYHLFVSVMVPQVIPGVAQIDVRSESIDVSQVSTSVARLTGPGSKYAPVPDRAQRSSTDPNLFTSSLWLMEYGSLRVILNVNGNQGAAQMSVPVPSFARKMLPMPLWLGALLLALTIGLGIGAVSIMAAAVRDSALAPGAVVTPESKRKGRRAMVITALVVAAIFYGAFAWWNVDARDFAATAKFFKPPKLAVTLIAPNQLELKPSSDDQEWIKYIGFSRLIPDHGHLMHLFLVRTPSLDRVWHLHPKQMGDGSFVDSLPAVEAGHYDVFADIVDKSGFPWTLVGSIDLPNINGTPLTGDDSGGVAPAIGTSTGSTVAVLSDGSRVVWHRDQSLKANVPTILRFEVEDSNGKPVSDLQPYMGMAAHAAIIKSDLTVFAHIHPSGTVPMASLMLARDKMSGDSSMAGMNMPPGMYMAMPGEHLSPEISIPYGFPSPGLYRIFLQFNLGGKIQTVSFDTHVD